LDFGRRCCGFDRGGLLDRRPPIHDVACVAPDVSSCDGEFGRCTIAVRIASPWGCAGKVTLRQTR
jgi:hypothetical protein